MGILFGGAGAALAGFPTFWLLQIVVTNLDSPFRIVVHFGLTAVAVVVGILVAGAIGRRVARGADGLPVFASLAAGLGGASIGALTFAVLTGAYLYAYGDWPQGIVSQVLYVLAIPVLGALGWFAGMLLGTVAGFVAGLLLSVLTLARR